MLSDRVRFISEFLKYDLPKSDYIIVNSAWLSLMGIRSNGDLDIVISNKLWDDKFNKKDKNLSFGLPGEFEKKIRVHSITKGPYILSNIAKSNDDLVFKNRVLINKIPLITPKLYFLYKVTRHQKCHEYIKTLPWWFRHGFYKGSHQKYFLKEMKDRQDFKSIRNFFTDKTKPLHELKKNKNIDWGLDNEVLKNFIFSKK